MNIKDDFILSELRDGYLVGGAVRDFLLGKTSYDRDIAIKMLVNLHENLQKSLMQLLLRLMRSLKYTGLYFRINLIILIYLKFRVKYRR